MNLGKLGIFQFKQTLECLNLILKILYPAVQFCIFASCAFQLFHRNSGAGINATRQLAIPAGGATFGSVTTGFPGDNQLQLITTCRRLRRYRLLLPARSCINGTPGRLKFLILLADNANCLSTRPALYLVNGGDTEHFAALQAIDVIVDECTRIQVLYCKHDLLHGNAVIGAYAGSNGPQGIGWPGWPEGIRLITRVQ